MASLENRTGYWNVVFRFGGRKFTRSLGTDDKREAETRLARLEENIRLVESGRLELPEGADVAAFLLSDGKVARKPTLAAAVTLAGLFDAFFAALPDGNLEETTLGTLGVHRRHLERHLGARLALNQVRTATLQDYVTKRSKEAGRHGETVSATTIKKELNSFRGVWNWGVQHDHVHGPFPYKGLRLPKVGQLPVFQTCIEIERQIKRGGLSPDEQEALWESLYLSRAEIDELLKHVGTHAAHPVIYPMFVMAAHTGARRSELLRSQLADIGDDEVSLRERKRERGIYSTRRVPMSSSLQAAMRDWLATHPGGPHTFCLAGSVSRSKKERDRPQPLTRDEANDHFHRTLRNSRWAKIKGWHCLRHSFISNLACEGVDQRLIDGYVGHTTEAMARRYRHLFPDTRRAAITRVFG